MYGKTAAKVSPRILTVAPSKTRYKLNNKTFGLLPEAWGLMPKASNSPNVDGTTEFDDFLTKFAKFFSDFHNLAKQQVLFVTHQVCWNVFLVFSLTVLYSTIF